ncbi:ECF transporter S component [Mesoplasma corruscae]|uniref:Uncharacterized protein n=1 Tax=Mesoplasma corruscae TaxID=216874 RepID=A0A2S5RH10_9MOLU|nr:ECF transporter S component [Mesoplasma corruscae]PPE06593.1 hypothetical protein MCORR_v1c02240 [Mesoplasma corruscae]
MQKTLEWIMEGSHLAYLSSALTFTIFVLYILFKWIQKKHLITQGVFIINEQFNTRNIAYMGIMIGCSVAVTVVISMTVPITVFPPIRVAFEGIMIKITGMIFGPIVGLIVGLVTELLTMLFIPSFIHPAYFFVAIGFGFWAGICSFSFKLKDNKQYITLIIITVFVIVSTLFLSLTLDKLPVSNPLNEGEITPLGYIEKVSIFGISMSRKMVPRVFMILMGIILILIYITFAILMFTNKKKYINVIMPIILICLVTEILVSILTASWGDAELLAKESENGYINMVALRVAQMPLKIIFNTSLLSTVYFVLRPLIKNK